MVPTSAMPRVSQEWWPQRSWTKEILSAIHPKKKWGKNTCEASVSQNSKRKFDLKAAKNAKKINK